MDYVIDDISLIGLADEKEYPVAEEYQPNGSNLDLVWEWGHNPDNRYWSLTDREGWLRLTNGHKVSATAKIYESTYGDLTYFETPVTFCRSVPLADPCLWKPTWMSVI